jgi:hypothetical protein
MTSLPKQFICSPLRRTFSISRNPCSETGYPRYFNSRLFGSSESGYESIISNQSINQGILQRRVRERRQTAGERRQQEEGTQHISPSSPMKDNTLNIQTRQRSNQFWPINILSSLIDLMKLIISTAPQLNLPAHHPSPPSKPCKEFQSDRREFRN